MRMQTLKRETMLFLCENAIDSKFGNLLMARIHLLGELTKKRRHS